MNDKKKKRKRKNSAQHKKRNLTAMPALSGSKLRDKMTFPRSRLLSSRGSFSSEGDNNGSRKVSGEVRCPYLLAEAHCRRKSQSSPGNSVELEISGLQKKYVSYVSVSDEAKPLLSCPGSSAVIAGFQLVVMYVRALQKITLGNFEHLGFFDGH